jgi:hypothetical protein
VYGDTNVWCTKQISANCTDSLVTQNKTCP